MENLTFKIDAFEGPMDLLYHLIDKNEIDIYDIPIFDITSQYLQYLEKIEYKNMDSMSEFLLMAATLLEIKSKMLLPLLVNEDKEVIDPREELVLKLIEYKKFKLIALKLQEDELGVRRMYGITDAKTMSLMKIKKTVELDEILGDITLNNLFNVFEDIMNRKELKVDKVRHSFNAVTKDLFTIDEKIDYLKNLIYLYNKISFLEIFDMNSSKSEKVVTFLALLELIKIKHVKINQEKIFDDITIEKW